MNDTLAKALIATAGILGGALVTALAAAYSARQKTRELELAYEQKLQENYLSNARQYIGEVYVPLSIALTQLSNAYRTFRSQISSQASHPDPIAETAFRTACQQYSLTLSELIDRGADAYLTTALDEELQSFNSFISNSVSSTEPVLRIVVSYSVSIPGMSSMRASNNFATEARGKWIAMLRSGNIGFNIFGMGIAYQAHELLNAPLSSHEFEKRIGVDIPALKFLIKEVTLGSQSKM